ncbi:hypothetical protein BDZ91DRAFT_767199 [Kalaharituber pfeilii]|nr:hypothetical protein BDZ91DRAFT_767199 [Kalaharituber pfeilii]
MASAAQRAGVVAVGVGRRSMNALLSALTEMIGGGGLREERGALRAVVMGVMLWWWLAQVFQESVYEPATGGSGQSSRKPECSGGRGRCSSVDEAGAELRLSVAECSVAQPQRTEERRRTFDGILRPLYSSTVLEYMSTHGASSLFAPQIGNDEKLRRQKTTGS